MDLKDEIMELINKGCDVRFSPVSKKNYCFIRVSKGQCVAEKILKVDNNCYADEMPIIVNELTEMVLLELSEVIDD